MSTGLFVVGLVLLILGAEALVRGASALALRLGVAPLVIGLTVVAYGTSAPELAVSAGAAWGGQGGLALGNVLGSNIFNVLFILGLAALIRPLAVSMQLLRADLWVMLGVGGLAWLLGADGGYGRADGCILLVAGALYTGWLLRAAARGRGEGVEQGASSSARRSGVLWGNVLLIACGLGGLVLGARWMVAGAVELARAIGMSEVVIGLTIVAAGTSLPEVAASVTASLRGARDISVGNVVGSNVFNVLIVLGAAAVVAPQPMAVTSSVLAFDFPIALIASAACVPVFFSGRRIDRWEGALFLTAYVAYTVYLVLDAQHHAALAWYGWGVAWIGGPVALATIAASLLTGRNAANREPAA